MAAPKTLLACVREDRASGEKMVVVINFSSEEKKVELKNLLPGFAEGEFPIEILMSTRMLETDALNRGKGILHVGANEGVLLGNNKPEIYKNQ